MQKIKEFLRSKRARVTMVTTLALAVMCMSCFAADGDTSSAATVTSAFATGFQSIADDAKSMIAMIVPIALGVAGTIFLARKAIGWFKSMAK